MPQYLDLYFLVDNRKTSTIRDFFNNYAFIKKELADEYPIPQFSDFIYQTFYSDNHLLKYLEGRVDCDYIIYWQNLNERSDIYQFMVQYTNDGKMIVGITVKGTEPSDTKVTSTFKEMKDYFNAYFGCITSEEAPPETSEAFKQFCRIRYSR
jgi:hypothetical protein